MKKLFVFSFLILLMAVTVSAQVRQGQTAWVSARTVTLKSSTGFFASNTGTVAYGDEVSILQVSGSNWAQVRLGSVSGWMSTGNLSTKRIAATGSTSSASASEVAMAGKGFSQEVENVYKSEGNLNYADVDRTESITIAERDLYQFVVDGHLAQGGN